MLNKTLVLVILLGTSSQSLAEMNIPERREFPIAKKIDPCQNFYEHVCSEVKESFTLPDDRNRHIFSFSDSAERLLQTKKDYLQGLDAKKALSPRAKDLATVYGSCMNEKARSQEELQIVSELIGQIRAIKTKDAFFTFVANMRHLGEYSFVSTGSIPNQDDSDWRDFYFIADIMTLPERSYYHNEKLMKNFQNLVESFFKEIGFKNTREKAKEIVNFEREFSENFPLPAEMREIFVTKSNIDRKDALKSYPSFRLQDDLAKVPQKVVVRHLTPKNYSWLEKKLQQTPLGVLKDLYLFHALNPIMDEAYQDYFKKKFAFNHEFLGGAKARPDRNERCTKWVMGTFPKEIDAELIDKVFPNFPEEKFKKLAGNVRNALIEGMKTNPWLSQEGKNGAIDKLQKARLQLVKPRNEEEWYFNPKLNFEAGKFLENKRRLSKAWRDRSFEELSQKRNKNRWGMSPLTVNAYYSPSDNKFVMPIGILQYPFYDPKLSDEANFGAVGVVIGHELGHGIDDKGAQFDGDGALRQWLTKDDRKNFESASQTFIKQFDEIGHNGELTLGENIGDWTGLTFAYQAAFPKNKGTVKQKQEFFTQYARLWCGVLRPKLKERLLKTDPHALGVARVNEQVKHQAGFIEAYSCKKGDPMYLPAEKRIKIW